MIKFSKSFKQLGVGIPNYTMIIDSYLKSKLPLNLIIFTYRYLCKIN